MIVKIVTDCNFAGCETTHFVEVDDNATEDDINDIGATLMENDIQPGYSWEISSEEEADDYGMDIEQIPYRGIFSLPISRHFPNTSTAPRPGAKFPDTTTSAKN